MYIENIIRGLQDLIHDVKQMENRVYGDRKEASRALSNGDEQDYAKEAAVIYEDGLIDAQNALQLAEEHLQMIQYRLELLVEQIEYEQLSSKVQSR